MLQSNNFVSGCVWESPVEWSTATLAPNVGLHAARDVDQQEDMALV